MFDRKRLQAQMVLRSYTGKRLSEELGITESTLYRKMNNDGDFSRSEINKMIDILQIEDPKAIFFATELA